MISQKAKYALRALMALAKAPPDSAILTADIARSQKIPKKFLEQILLDLKRAGFVASRRGRDGGYALLKGADEITFGAVLRKIDGPIAPLPCLSMTAYRRCVDCESEPGCEIRRVFGQVAEATRRVLDRTTLEAAVNGPAGAPFIAQALESEAINY